MPSLRDHLYRIRHQILNDPLNAGQRLHFLGRYITWNLVGKYGREPWIITFDNGMRSIVRPAPDDDAGVVNIWTRNVDWYDTALVRRVLRPGDRIVDAGCNVGNRTWALADLIDGALMIDAGERAVERARQNLSLNDLSPERFRILHKAVGARSGRVAFTNKGGASTLNHVVGSLDGVAPDLLMEVEMTTIDHELEQLGWAPTYMKLDLEGHELAALHGALNTLSNRALKLVKFEHNSPQPLQPLIDLFEEHGFIVFSLVEGRISLDPETIRKCMNLFAARSQVLSELQNVRFAP